MVTVKREDMSEQSCLGLLSKALSIQAVAMRNGLEPAALSNWVIQILNGTF